MSMEIKSLNEIISLETKKLNKLRNQYVKERANLQNFEKQIRREEKTQKTHYLTEYKTFVNGLKKEKIRVLKKLEDLKANATQLNLERGEKLRLLNLETIALEEELKKLELKSVKLNQQSEILNRKLKLLKKQNIDFLTNKSIIDDTIKIFRNTLKNDYQLMMLCLNRCQEFGRGIVSENYISKVINNFSHE